MDKARALGAKSIDIQGIKVVFTNVQPTLAPSAPTLENKPTEGVEAGDSQEAPIPNKVVELTSVMKLSDNELLDNLFPDHTDYSELES